MRTIRGLGLCLVVWASATGVSRAEWAFTFTGTDDGNTVEGVSGAMTLDWQEPGLLVVNVDNTSSVRLADGSLNLAGITSFGFNVDPSSLTINDVSWKLTAFDDKGGPVLLGGGNGTADPTAGGYFDLTGMVSTKDGRWELDTDTGGAIRLDFTTDATKGANGALRNPDLLGETGYSTDTGRYYTQAVLTVKFWEPSSLNLSSGSEPQMRWQEAGPNQELSAKAVGVPVPVVPVPPSLAMLGSGGMSVLVLAWMRRRKMR